MGSTDPRSERWDEWSESTQGSSFWDSGWWGLLTRDPDFMQAWIDRWQSLRRDLFSSPNLAALTTTLAAGIDPDAAARDAARWPDNASRDGNSFRGEVDLLTDWLTHRAQWIDQQFVARPIEVSAEDGRRIVAPPGLLIAYTLDGSDPRDAGGGIATGASLVPGPLLIESGTYVVRIYAPTAAGAFPGSPWSAPAVISTGDTTPSTPPAPVCPRS